MTKSRGGRCSLLVMTSDANNILHISLCFEGGDRDGDGDGDCLDSGFPLGVSATLRNIPDSAITVSTYYNVDLMARYARLYQTADSAINQGAWCVR